MNDRTTSTPGDLSRRRFLQGSAMVGVAAFLAACTPGGSSAAPGGSAAPGASASAGAGASGGVATPTGPLNFANWDAYIDLTTIPGPDGAMDTDDDEYD